MLNPEKLAMYDQSKEEIIETIPPLLVGLQKGFVREGFTGEQSFELVKVYLSSMVSNAKGDKT